MKCERCGKVEKHQKISMSVMNIFGDEYKFCGQCRVSCRRVFLDWMTEKVTEKDESIL